MREQSGRSLIEIMGVLAIGAVMTAATYKVFRNINQKADNMVASETLKDIKTNIQTMKSPKNGYLWVSVDALIEAGALKNAKTPIGKSWSITPNYDGSEFSLNLFGLDKKECDYFLTKKFDWAERVSINNSESQKSGDCWEMNDNNISIFVK